ncbi:hypothetical protein BD408DRAFT_378793 [Parasitella parasitica]|nr:hypothetical protein BD408DRAFT_378793 [Parasitella parasitica]
MNTILSHVWEYTSLFKEDNFSKFTNWCRTQKLNFTTPSVKRKHEDSSPTSRSILRNLYVLKDQHKDALIEDIVNLPIQYQQYIMDLKIQGYFIIGYCRKSKTTADNEKVTKCLQSMVLGLKEKSLAQKVYVTVSCNAGTPFKKRDIKKKCDY